MSFSPRTPNKGDYTRALAKIDQVPRPASAAWEQAVQGMLGFIHARAGHQKETETILGGLERRERMGEPVAAAIASIHGALGATDRAFEFLERSYRRNELDLGYLKVDPKWDRLREIEVWWLREESWPVGMTSRTAL